MYLYANHFSGPGTSDEWFSQLNELNALLRARGAAETDDQHEPVKVAVLDTGIRKDNYTKHSNSIKKYRDYVTEQDGSPTDTSASGHGTHIVELVLKTFNTAHIYLARVFEQEKLYDDDKIEAAQSCIAKVNRCRSTFVLHSFSMTDKNALNERQCRTQRSCGR